MEAQRVNLVTKTHTAQGADPPGLAFLTPTLKPSHSFTSAPGKHTVTDSRTGVDPQNQGAIQLLLLQGGVPAAVTHPPGPRASAPGADPRTCPSFLQTVSRATSRCSCQVPGRTPGDPSEPQHPRTQGPRKDSQALRAGDEPQTPLPTQAGPGVWAHGGLVLPRGSSAVSLAMAVLCLRLGEAPSSAGVPLGQPVRLPRLDGAGGFGVPRLSQERTGMSLARGPPTGFPHRQVNR